LYHIKCGESESQRMTNGEGGNKNEYFFPVSKNIHRTKRKDKQNMVKALKIQNMLESKFKIQLKRVHSWAMGLQKK
jgi:hypothetical protein